MPPKVKAKAKARGRRLAPMVMVRLPRGKARAKALAKAKAKAAGRMRRPAQADPGLGAGADPLEAWRRGDIVEMRKVPLDEVLKAPLLVVEEGSYFQSPCRIAGLPQGSVVSGPDLYVRLKPTGTTHEGILRLQTGTPELSLRLHWCQDGCGEAETAVDLIHVKKVRMGKGPTQGEGWYNNLEKAAPAQEDELADLRARADGAAALKEGEKLGIGEGPKAEKEDDKKKKKKDKEKKKDEKDKDKKKKAKKRSSSTSRSVDSSDLNGSRPRVAATKTLKALFQGTGLDPKEKIRAKVSRSAKRSVKKKSKQDSTSQSTGTSSSSKDEDGGVENFFLQATKAKSLAETHPGALTSQTLGQMKASLLQEAGLESQRRGVEPVALQYFRSVLSRKGTGPMIRELYTLSACIDALLRGRPCHALDIMSQRVKSLESTLGGVHWSVSQRLEILGQDAQGLAASQEVREAQRDAYSDQKLRYLAAQPEGRAGKSTDKGKGKTYQGREGGKKGGKGAAGKEQGKKKDDQPSRG